MIMAKVRDIAGRRSRADERRWRGRWIGMGAIAWNSGASVVPCGTRGEGRRGPRVATRGCFRPSLAGLGLSRGANVKWAGRRGWRLCAGVEMSGRSPRSAEEKCGGGWRDCVAPFGAWGGWDMKPWVPCGHPRLQSAAPCGAERQRRQGRKEIWDVRGMITEDGIE
jgi:hypothetical protein